MPTYEEAVAAALAENQPHRQAMMEAIVSREAIAFLGAGLSAPLHYPQWNALLDDLAAIAAGLGNFQPSAQGALLRAEEIKRHFMANNALDQYFNELGRRFGECEAGHTATHMNIVRLPFRGFITTNYDPCAESALASYAVEIRERPRTSSAVPVAPGHEYRHLLSTFLRSISKGYDRKQRYVAHIHGIHTHPREIILANSDYERAYGVKVQGAEPPATIHRQLMWSVLATRRLIFFGCGMDDPPINALLQTVCSDLWEWRLGNHFVVLALDRVNVGSASAIRNRFAQYGIEPVFFDNLNGDFTNLDRMLEDVIQLVQPSEAMEEQSVAASGPTVNAGPAASPGPDIGPQWLENVNVNAVKDLESK